MKEQFPYRFKTKDEMIKQYGKYWKDFAFPGIGWNDSMDIFLGQDYEYCKDELCLENIKQDLVELRLPRGHRGYKGWTICWDMLTSNIIIPNYNPKKIIRTL